ncbi:MAG: hypothetical protein ACI35O_14335 [Bacillaceae bacterium]
MLILITLVNSNLFISGASILFSLIIALTGWILCSNILRKNIRPRFFFLITAIGLVSFFIGHLIQNLLHYWHIPIP